MDLELYLFNVILFVIFTFQLFYLRSGIHEYLRQSKHSKTYINKKKKGFLNFWIYKQINVEYPMKRLYYINIIYLIAFVVFSVLALPFGYLKIMEFPLAIIATIFAALGVFCTVFASAYCHKSEYGKKFVLLEKRKNSNGYDSSFFDMFFSLLPILVIYIFHS